jgi:probable FeS assembly SUF system protein SufT
MNENTTVTLSRDVEATVVPAGHTVTLQKDQRAHITQSLGGTYTVIVNGNMFRIAQRNADALGFETSARSSENRETPRTQEAVEKEVWNLLRTCYDPEIPVNIVDLGLVYDCTLTFLPADNQYRVQIRMTLTAPGCGMGPVMVQDVREKLFSLDEIIEADVELVFDPPWNQAMISEAAQLQLGIL